MPRPLNPRCRAAPLLLALAGGIAGTLAWAGPAAAQPAPVRTGVLQLNERRAPVILDTPQNAGGAEIIDESALRYYAAQRQGERVQAEIARLRRRHPNWTVPADLDTLKPSPPEEAPMWDLFTAGRFDELRTAISVRQSVDPGWQPSEDLARKLNRGTLRSAARAAARDGSWDDLIARVKGTQEGIQNLDIDIAWTLAEAYARTGDIPSASALYGTLLKEQADPGLRLATVQKAMAAMPMAAVEPLLAMRSPGTEGTDEFRSIHGDVTRARIAAVLHGQPAGRIEPADLAALGEQARRVGEPAQIALLGWYAYHRRQFREALDWFKTALARGGDAAVATGLALSLREMGQDREAEEAAFTWRNASVTNLSLYVDMMERRLGEGPASPVETERLDRFAKVVLATSAPEGAQALGWYAYNACQFDAAADWFQRAVGWRPRESAVLGYALSLSRLKRTRDYLETVNRYDGLFPKVVGLVFAEPDPQARDTGPCGPAPAVPQQAAAPAPPRVKVPKPTVATTPVRPLAVQRGEFPIMVPAENPLRFGEGAFLTPRARDAEYLREVRGPQPLVARRVVGVGAMPYERYGFTLLPGWNGLARASLQAGPPAPPVGTLAQAEAGILAQTGSPRLVQPRDGDRFGPFDTASTERSGQRNPGLDR
jgi:tetratricopeptide (TPR) repeat protein